MIITNHKKRKGTKKFKDNNNKNVRTSKNGWKRIQAKIFQDQGEVN